ncbi:MAG: hypothetical protein GXP29_05360 [Planctomycetes bacterium]|nr:hypothetical protein [Planctomycetota bacterium]
MPQEFRFRLQAVQRVRQLEFEHRQRIVGERLRKIGGEQAIIAALSQDLTSMNDETKRLLSGGSVDVGSVSRYRLRVGYIREQIASSEMQILELERELAAERAAMVKASVAVKAIDKLRERRHAAYLVQVKRRETVEQDETALQMHRWVHDRSGASSQ